MENSIENQQLLEQLSNIKNKMDELSLYHDSVKKNITENLNIDDKPFENDTLDNIKKELNNITNELTNDIIPIFKIN